MHAPVRAELVEALVVHRQGFDKLSPNGYGGFDKLSPNGDGGPDPHRGQPLKAP